jgi:hypothetical protein
MAVPEPLASALATIPADPRFELVDGWTDRGGGVWSFQFRAELSVPASEHIGRWSGWHLVASPCHGGFDIDIHPDTEDGITATFPHQSHNDPPVGDGVWRTGNPCLERPTTAFRRNGWSGEPAELDRRIDWHIGRLFTWIDAAASDRLLEEGDPIELPVLPSIAPGATIGFWEDREGLDWWRNVGVPWGFATLANVPSALGTAAVADFMNPQRTSIRRPAWGPGLPVTHGKIDAVWFVMPVLVVGAPWRLPSTWEQLSGYCSEVSVDLPDILAQAGAKLRHIERPGRSVPSTLLMGFPMAETKGADPERMHWLAVGNMRTARRDDVRRGFSNRGDARRQWDRALAADKRQLDYIRTANWAPDQIRRRGAAEDEVQRKSVLLIGGGALGGAVAENLVRMGVTRMGIIDADLMNLGNLSRHTLTMRELGHGKAKALAAALNRTMPDANVEDLTISFPPTKVADRRRLEGWDVIVDCTAEDAVLRAMADYSWDGVKVFVSLSMTWRAQGLFAYADEQASFPATDAIERFLAVSAEPEEDALGLMEGIGCWHPVFPASADDVRLWAAVGTKFIRRAVMQRGRICEHFVQDAYGAIERRAA